MKSERMKSFERHGLIGCLNNIHIDEKMIKFVEFISTPDEKHVGIVTINYDDKMLLRYKAMKRNDNGNLFFKPASYKIGEEYVDAFMFDSRILEAEIDRVIREGIKGHSVHFSKIDIQSAIENDTVPF